MSSPNNNTSSLDVEMRVLKRNGNYEDISFDKILKRVKILGHEANLNLNYTQFVMKVIDQLYDGISTSQIDELAAEQCASLITTNQEYGVLASRIVISNCHKKTPKTFYEAMEKLYEFRDVNDKHSPLLSEKAWSFIQHHKDYLDSLIDIQRDYLIDYFGFKTLERSYLMKVNKETVERPQYMWLRVAVGIHGVLPENDIQVALQRIRETYELMSQKYFIHATPTLFNSATPRPQLSSCYLIAMENDSIDGIFNTLKECAQISKWAGGIGLHIHNVRGYGTHIRGTNGNSNGIVPMLRVFNSTARYVDQCVTPETIIYTSKGPIEIQHCMINDTQTFNINGEVETIENVLEHPYEGELLNIKTMHAIDNLKITPEHPVYALQHQSKGLNYSVILNRIEKGLANFDWVEAKELTLDDLLVFSIPQYNVDVNYISQDDCYMYGVILGDGCMNNDSMTGYISVHTENKKHILDFACNYFDNKCIQYKISTEGNITRIRWNKHINMPFRYGDVYDNNKEKHIHYKWLNLPIEKSKFILKGLLDTDGCNHKELVFDSTSRNLIESVRFICLKMGLLTSGYIRDRVGETHETSRGTITNKKISYCLRIPRTQEICDLMNIEFDNKQFFKFLRYKNYLLTRIKSIEKSTYNGTLYDLQLRNEHNYMVHNCLLHNGGGKRNGSFAIYLEPWHTDIYEFLDLRKNHGDEELRARDLFYALWIPDLFMERVNANAEWSLFCPDICPGLSDAYGDKFKELYLSYEEKGLAKKTVKARDLWFAILDSQMETGTPYLLYKDSSNIKSNQKNLGTIKSSNLCVAGETKILTSKGDFNIEDIVNQEVEVWNGQEFSKVTIRKTGENQKLIKVLLSNGSELECTPYHKFYIENEKGDEVIIEAENLVVGMKIPTYKLPNDDTVYNINIKGIVDENKYADTFCFNEPLRHRGIFNGILTSQCTEILEYSDENETAVCNLASIALNRFVQDKVFDYNLLVEVTKVITRNLNKVIDVNFYPTEKTERSNMRHRPIGIGVQGLADTFALMDIPFHSEAAREVNKNIFESIYYGALLASNQISKDRLAEIEMGNIKYEYIEGPSDKDIHKNTRLGSYSTFYGSPMSEGKFQFDLWNQSASNRYDWESLRQDIIKYGLRNSLLVAPMPTASTSQILGNNECFEPFTSNIYSRRTLAGEFIVANKYLMKELQDLGLWNNAIKDNIIANKGSIQHIEGIPQHIKDKYKIVWEIPMRQLIDMAAERGPFICQSQSMNLWIEDPNYKTLTAMHFYSWKSGLKTGIYYLRRKPKHQAQQFTIVPKQVSNNGQVEEEEEEACEMCSG